MNKSQIKEKLGYLIDEYNNTLRKQNKAKISEETVRTWLNEFLLIFGWDVKDTGQVWQEQVLKGEERRRLYEIQSSHSKPDYTLVNGSTIKTFLDAKSLDVNIFTNDEVAFQIRSYGWSAQVPCAFVSNFEQFVIYDTRFVPSDEQDARFGTTQLTVDEYLDNIDLLYEHLQKEKIYSNILDRLYETTAIEGKERVDSYFMDILSDFRVELAEELYTSNTKLIKNDEVLNYYVQVIMDRLVFIRVCESKGIEHQGKLKSFLNSDKGFWEEFKNSCYMEFYEHYDGAMFSRDKDFQRIILSNELFEKFVQKLYYPYPYKFDVIPVKVIANIYEEFLGKQLILDNNRVKEVTKEEYVRSNGAVATPEHIVDMVCKQTIDLSRIKTIDDLLNIKILDPCCGSGVFIVSCFEHLSEKALEILSCSSEERKKHAQLYCKYGGQYLLTIEGRRSILTHCIYAIDCDESAIEVTKMSLALKVVDGTDFFAWNDIGVYGEKVLKEIDKNIALGNTLVGLDQRFSARLINDIKPFDIKKVFKEVFESNDGFTFILGNPPYVETKYYKAAQPAMHAYLSEKYTAFEGKADLAVLFIERGISLLSENGKLGFIIQRRWFKTQYGAAIRRLIDEGNYLNKLIDFQATDIFAGRIVYASIMVLSKSNNPDMDYYYMPSNKEEIRTKFENCDVNGLFEGLEFKKIPTQKDGSEWAFEKYEITMLKKRLGEELGVLADYPGLQIKDGIQALWKKMYHLTNCSVKDGVITGYNGFKERVTVEEDITRGVIYNRVFYPFKDVEPDAYCIFSYVGSSSEPIVFSDVKRKYPLAYDYLNKNKDRITDYVKCRDGDLWHTFTREHNQTMYGVDKIIIPMTARDTIGTFVHDKGLYMDNANVWFITIDGADHRTMKAVTCIINSTVFSVLGKAGANPQSGGYFKFNKQFLVPIPFPIKEISTNKNIIDCLSNMYDEISALQEEYLSAIVSKKRTLRHSLEAKWNALDEICYKLYELTDDDIRIVSEEGRTIDRIELLEGVNE